MNGSPAICAENRVHRAQRTAFGPAVAEGLVLQRAFATLVADRAVERVIDEQQLHHALLRFVGDGRGELGVHGHSLGNRGRTGS
jgi:hypothetical protein